MSESTKNINKIAKEIGAGSDQVAAAVELLDDDNTLPFIARYRKEATGGLDEEQLRKLKESLDYLRSLDKRRQTIVTTIEGQGKVTPELSERLLTADSITDLEDLYLPYKPKRRTRARIARERGLEGLAQSILAQQQPSCKPRTIRPGSQNGV